jgi:uncharacterized membrane protein
MNKTLKWILGILIGLLVLAAIAAVAFFGFGGWYGHGMMGAYGFRNWEGRGVMPMHPGGFWGRSGGFRGGGFFWLGMLPGLLFNLGILVLIVLGVIYLVRALTGHRAPATTNAQISAAEPVKTCSNCGKSVQADWMHCPYCGNSLA